GRDEGHLAVFHRVDAALRPAGEQNRAVAAAADGIDQLALELADGLDEAVGIDLIDLAAAAGGALARAVERDGDFRRRRGRSGALVFLRLGRRGGAGGRRGRALRLGG